jgi:hypothetical protein
MDTGSAAKRIHFQPCIVGDSRQARVLGNGTRLLYSVGFTGISVFDHVRGTREFIECTNREAWIA